MAERKQRQRQFLKKKQANRIDDWLKKRLDPAKSSCHKCGQAISESRAEFFNGRNAICFDCTQKNLNRISPLRRQHPQQPTTQDLIEKARNITNFSSTAFNLKNSKIAQLTMVVRIKDKKIELDPKFLFEDCFGKEDLLDDFLDNLHDDECCIITEQGKDINALRKLKLISDQDVDSSAKALEIEG